VPKFWEFQGFNKRHFLKKWGQLSLFGKLFQEYRVSCRLHLKCDCAVQKPDFVFRRNGRVHLNRRGRQFSRLLAAEVCASAVVMLDTPCSEVVRRVLATHSIRQFPLQFPSRASPPFNFPPVRHRVPSHFKRTLSRDARNLWCHAVSTGI
jgi:hypothetical protein